MGILNDRIKEIRTARGLTLKDVAASLGVEEATAQRYESGSIKNIKHEIVCQLADLFRCNPSYLMGWSQSPYILSEDKKEYSINEYEMELIKKYRLLDPRGQQAVLDTIERELGFTEQPVALSLAARSGETANRSISGSVADAALRAVDLGVDDAEKENEGL